MSAIRVRFTGQFGNQLFQYVIGKIVAERTGMSYTPWFPHFVDRRGAAVRWSNGPFFFPLASDGTRPDAPPLRLHLEQYCDLATLDGRRPVHIEHGYFQRYELIRDYRTRIRRDWLPIPPTRYVATDDDAVYIHVRRTDYVAVDNKGSPPDTTQQGAASTVEDFARCLEFFPGTRRLIVLTDNPADPYLQNFEKLGRPWAIEPGSWDGDFLKLASCRHLVLSQSTFSWWAGFLGRAVRIACPTPPGSFWGRGVGLYGPGQPRIPNLFVDDEPGRWIWVV